MHWPDLDNLQNDPPGMPNDPGWAYGAFLLSKLTEWDPQSRRLGVHYVMSTSRPYQVQLMRSVLTL